MVHTDNVVRDLEFAYEGVFNFKELLSVMKDFLKRYDYDVDEKLYDTKVNGDLRNIKIKWSCDKKVDDYNKCFVKLTIDLNDFKEGYVDGEKVVDGKLKITFNAEVERDYGEKWKKSPSKKFIRALNEKYVSQAKQNKVDSQLKGLVDALKKEVKGYLEN